MRKELVFTAVVGLLVASSGACLADQLVGVPEVYNDHLRWDDLILRGTVTGFDRSSMPANVWYNGLIEDESPIQLIRLTVDTHDVLRGGVPSGPTTLWLRVDDGPGELALWDRITVGGEVLITADYAPWLSPQWRILAIFVPEGEGWSQYKGSTWSAAANNDDINNRIDSVSLPRVAKDADVIVKGSVVSSGLMGTPGNEVIQYTIHPEQVVAGKVNGDLTFVAQKYIGDEARWREFFPYELEAGKTYYFFLRRSPDGILVPAGGYRTALRVEGDQVFQVTGAPTNYQVKLLDRELASLTQHAPRR